MNKMPVSRALVSLAILVSSALLTPTYAQGISVNSALTIESTLLPGASATGTIKVSNAGDVPRQAKAYQTDLALSPKGGMELGEPGTHPRSNASWLTITPREFTVPARATILINYRISVPSDDTLKGTYFSMVFVEGIAPENLESPKESANPVFTMKTAVRYGVQMITDIGASGTRELKFVDKQIVTRDGKRMLQLDVANTGERGLRTKVWAEFYDEAGVSAGHLDAGVLRLIPGWLGRFRIDLSALPSGKYTSMVIADNGDDAVFGAQYDLELE